MLPPKYSSSALYWDKIINDIIARYVFPHRDSCTRWPDHSNVPVTLKILGSFHKRTHLSFRLRAAVYKHSCLLPFIKRSQWSYFSLTFISICINGVRRRGGTAGQGCYVCDPRPGELKAGKQLKMSATQSSGATYSTSQRRQKWLLLPCYSVVHVQHHSRCDPAVLNIMPLFLSQSNQLAVTLRHHCFAQCTKNKSGVERGFGCGSVVQSLCKKG